MEKQQEENEVRRQQKFFLCLVMKGFGVNNRKPNGFLEHFFSPPPSSRVELEILAINEHRW